MSTPTTLKNAREEEERREIESILESGILKNAPNLQRFLEFVADKHFEDILKEQGKGAVVMTSHHVRPTAHGMLDLYFTPIQNYSLVKAIEIEAER